MAIQVTRDKRWFFYLKEALSFYKTETPDPKCVQYANAFWRHQTCSDAIKAKKHERRIRKLK
jgi:hypothetical protein